jgi:hypothetical protein
VPNTAHITQSTLCVLCSQHIQYYYSSAYSGLNIQLNVSALLLDICRHFGARCTANLVPNTAHDLRFMLCELCSPTFTMYLQLRIFSLQHSTERICAANGYMPTFRCALNCKFGVKYSAHPPFHSMWTVVLDISNIFIAPHIHASILNWTYLRCSWRYLDNSTSNILQDWCQIQVTYSSLSYVYCGPDISNITTVPHIQDSIFNWTYLRCYWRYLDNSVRVILQSWCPIQRTFSGLRYVNCGPGYIQYIYSSAHSEFNIHLNVSALLLEISRQFNARYTANLVPNTAHILRFTLCDLWSRTYTMQLHLRIFRLQYTSESICSDIGYISTIQCALYGTHGAKHSAHPPLYAIWTVLPDIYNVITAPHIQASIFIWIYLRWYWWYADIWMRLILQFWWHI